MRREEMSKIFWGVLSTAKIGVEKVIPAMQGRKYSEISAIASRDLGRAKKAAKKLGIPRAYGSYEELLADREVAAIYIPLPNHLHVEWTIKSLEAGKHVLVEKSLGVNLKEVESLGERIKRFSGLKVMEAFMYRFHPQWKKVRELMDRKIGDLRWIHSTFSYYDVNPKDIRNQADIGGGGLLDIGCYCISVSRFLFKGEPHRVCASIEYDPKMRIDRLASAVLEFRNGISTFTCSTQLTNQQRAEVFGTRGRIEIEYPFTPPQHTSTKLIYREGESTREFVFEGCDQYKLQGDQFSQAILENLAAPTPIEDGIANMRVIERIVESSRRGRWVKVQ
jgi:predicted dehydrogenase